MRKVSVKKSVNLKWIRPVIYFQMKEINKITKEQFERATQEIKERGISITTWCNENNITPSLFYTIKWKNKNKELKVSKAITPIKEIDDNS